MENRCSLGEKEMASKTSLVVASIHYPTAAMLQLAERATAHGMPFYVIGDLTMPADFDLPGCDFYDVARQSTLEFKLASRFPATVCSYARKNIGYLLAMQSGARIIKETDDDNFPLSGFWHSATPRQFAHLLQSPGWENVYRYFTTHRPIWPRGLPLDAIHSPLPHFDELEAMLCTCPIQQGLVDQDPDVDAIYRLVTPKHREVYFGQKRLIALAEKCWCPFNSQNTTWFEDAFPLMYLPLGCSMRLTDIWRSFVAQRIAWENNWHVLFAAPTMYQVRNEHDLMKDFRDEIMGYVHNRRIGEELDKLSLLPGVAHIRENMLRCYDVLVSMGLLDSGELVSLGCWLSDVAMLRSSRGA